MILSLIFAIAATAADSSVIEHTQRTTASPAAVYAVWTDVPNWPAWDSGLRSATLDGPWKPGAKGQLVPDQGPKAKFLVAVAKPDEGYTLHIPLPLGRMILTRSIVSSDASGTVFRHRVQITGFAKVLFKGTLRRYRDMLPQVTAAVAKQAEQRMVQQAKEATR